MMKSILNSIVSLFLVFSAGCKTNKLSEPETTTIAYPKTLELSKIFCFNMAEKTAGIGLGNDEILLLIYDLNASGEFNLIKSTEILTFEKESKERLDLNISIEFKGENVNNKLKLILIELDTEKSKEEIINLVGAQINLKQSEEEFKEKLRDDDLLGIKTLNLVRVQRIGKVRFWGVHLFDEYHYEISYLFK